MKVDGKDIRTIWLRDDANAVCVIDQRALPHEFIVADLMTVDQVMEAILEMFVRGAPLIGATGAWGMYIAALNAPDGRPTDDYLNREAERLKSVRPTAVNLAWAVDRVVGVMLAAETAQRAAVARREAEVITEEEVDNCRRIGENGLPLIASISRANNGRPVNILTHCNAGWLACIEYGTATAPMYAAFEAGIDIHVWVDETRPLNQGARLTAWELGKHGVAHTVITDNAGGHLMQHGMVDIVIVGSDRTTYTGDVANKIGTYLKALAAHDNQIPFFVAIPSSTIDWTIRDGVAGIPIEERDPAEISYIQGRYDNKTVSVLVPPADSAAANHAFDVTPARLVTGLITERGVCEASEKGVLGLFPEKA
jgi:methylthioribose-1-phosphate isomerase